MRAPRPFSASAQPLSGALRAVCVAVLASLPGAFAEPALAQLPAGPTDARQDGVVLEELSYEKLLEESLKQAMTSYLGNDRFIVQVRVKMQRIHGQGPRPLQVLPAPLQPALTANLPGTEPLDPDEVDLPGLPARPAAARPAAAPVAAPPSLPPVAQQAAAPVAEAAGLRIDRVRILTVIEKNLAQEERDFIEKLIYQKADLNFARGDSLEIMNRQFPPTLQKAAALAATGTDSVTTAAGLPVAAPLAAGTAPVAGESDPAIRTMLAVLLGLLGLGLVLGLIALLRRRKPDAAPATDAPPAWASALMPQPAKEAQAPAGPSAEEQRAARAAQALRQEIVAMLLEQPELAAPMIGGLARREEGLQKVANLLRVLGMAQAARTVPGLADEERTRVEAALLSTRDVATDEAVAVLEEAYPLLVAAKAEQGAQVGRKLAPFSFLDRIDDSQVLWILQDEGSKVRALVLSQLPYKRAAGLMAKWPVEEQGPVATALGELEAIPLTTFESIAEKLAMKASQAPSFSAVVTDGVGLLVNILDNADATTEQRILDNLKTQNPDMMRKVRELYLTFADLPRLPAAVIKDAVRELDPGVVAQAIRDAEEPLQEAVLGAMTDKRRALLMDALERLEGQPVDPDGAETARREVVGRIRDMVRQGRFSMKTLAEG
ncbi:MAG: FliG C-terminal domain-containing protein [Candidatus Sericytochromatia bacterium]|nr:FliG C-terminal domain-containing protein [Candidatus Sericytochromatia bacterium]